MLVTAFAVSFVAVGVPRSRASDQVIGHPTLELNVPNNQVTRGTQTTIDIQITNDGELLQAGTSSANDQVRTARATRIQVTSGDTPIQVDTGVYPVGTVTTGTTGPIPIKITVPESTPVGTYQLPVRVRYTYTHFVDTSNANPQYRDTFFDGTQTITVQVKKSPRFAVVAHTSDVQVGDQGNLTVTMQNVGDQVASDATVTVTSGSDEVTFGTGSKQSSAFVGRWAPGQTRTAEYTTNVATDATVRNYTLDLSVAYQDPDGISGTSRTLQLGLRPRAKQSFGLVDVRSDVEVGKDGNVSGTIVNRGPATAFHPVVNLAVDNPNLDVPEPAYAVPELAPGERASFSFEVDASDSASAGARQFSFTVSYRDAQGDAKTSDTLPARIAVKPKRNEFTVEPLQNRITVGSGGALTLRVTNAGNSPVTDVSAKLFANDPLSTADDQAFVSRLDPGESTNMTFQVSSGGSALAKTYPVSLDFQYDNAAGDTVLSDTYRVPVDVQEPTGGGGPPILPIAIVLVVLIAGGYVVYRRWGADWF